MSNLYKKDTKIILFTPSDGDDSIGVDIAHKEQGHKYYNWIESQPELESLGFHGVDTHDDCWFTKHTDVNKLKIELESRGFEVCVY